MQAFSFIYTNTNILRIQSLSLGTKTEKNSSFTIYLVLFWNLKAIEDNEKTNQFISST